MPEAVKAILSKLNAMQEQLDKINKQLESVPVIETKLTSVFQRMKTLEETLGVCLDKEANKSKDKDKSKEQKNNDDDASKRFSIKEVKEEDRPPYWNYKAYDDHTLWSLYQSKKGRKILKNIRDSQKDTEKVKEAQKALKMFLPKAKVVLDALKEGCRV